MTDSQVWTILMIPQAEGLLPRQLVEDTSNAYEVHSKCRAVCVASLSQIVQTFLSCGLPVEEINYTQLCGRLGNADGIAGLAGRITIVRRFNDELLEELAETVEANPQVTVRVIEWDRSDGCIKTVPLLELYPSEENDEASASKQTSPATS